MNIIDEHCKHLQRRGLAPATIAIRRRRLGILEAHVGIMPATPEAIEAMLDGRNLGVKARYDWLSHLGQFYRWAIDWGHLTTDPTAKVARPRQRRNLPRPIDTGDLVLALQMATPTMRAWLSLMAFSGLRCMEVAGLDVDDLLWDDGLIRIHGKGGKERLVPMHPDVAAALRSITRPKRGALFRRPHGGRFPAAQVSREVATFLDDLGIAATAHQIRHWFGTHTYRVSRDLRVVQELMGHSSPTTTSVYADWSREEAARTIAQLSVDAPPSLLSEWAA